MSLVWKYDHWSARWPSLGSDEMYRHTLVLPRPFMKHCEQFPEYGNCTSAVCIVVRPWWLCTYAIFKDFRTYVRFERQTQKLWDALPDNHTEKQWEETVGVRFGDQPPYPKHI